MWGTCIQPGVLLLSMLFCSVTILMGVPVSRDTRKGHTTVLTQKQVGPIWMRLQPGTFALYKSFDSSRLSLHGGLD